MNVYEVEFDTGNPAFRFNRHVMAESPEDAIAIAIQRQQTTWPVKDVRLFRQCRPGERPMAVVGGIPTVTLDENNQVTGVKA